MQSETHGLGEGMSAAHPFTKQYAELLHSELHGAPPHELLQPPYPLQV
jgi:hypothetical protein